MSIVLTVVAVFAVLVIIAQLTQQNPATGEKPSPISGAETKAGESSAASAEELPIVKREDGDPMAIGDVDAPVVLVWWTDMRCPFCAVFDRETLPLIMKEYVDTGKVRIEVHDVAFFGEDSEAAAIAGHAAAEQGKFFEFVSSVYAEAPEGARPDLPRERLIYFAEKAGVPDLDKFTADLDDPEIIAAAQQSTMTAQGLGVNSVPFFVTHDTAMSGAQPIESFREFLDAALERAQ